MGCTSCAKKKANSYQDYKTIETPPFRATDIIVYDVEGHESRKFEKSDWNTNVINVLLFIPNLESLKEINFKPQENVEYTYVTSQPIHQVNDYLKNIDVKLAVDRIFCSYLLPSRTGLLHNGNTKKAVMYIMPDGDTVKHEYFYSNTFDYADIRNFLGYYVNDNH